MTNPNLLVSIVVSACLGALIGLIRQWSDQTEYEQATDLGGVRTYTFWAMLGCIGAVLSPGPVPVLLMVILALVGVFQIVVARNGPIGHPGSTTFAAALLTVLVGALVWWQYRQAAVVVAAVTMVLLGMKQTIHAWTRAFKIEDIRATLQFVAITGAILPLVPDREFGPYGGFNPYSTWLMVVLISGLGFVGYIAMRWFGAKAGIFLTSLLGGIASSTATTLAFSRRSREDPALSDEYSLAVVTACSVMLPRIIIAVGVINPGLALMLITPFACLMLPGVVFGGWHLLVSRSPSNLTEPPRLSNPLCLTTAVKFGLLYALIAFLVKAATQLDLLNSSLIPLSFVSGLTDMDAISLSMAASSEAQAIPYTLATRAIIIAAVGNSLLKAGLAASLGSPSLRRKVSLVLGLTAAFGVASLWLT